MATLMQAVERLRESGVPMAGGALSARALFARFPSQPTHSVRALVSGMFRTVAKKLPWAILLCRFKGLPGNPGIEQYFRDIFRPGSKGLVEYWSDITLGAIDVSDSRVFGWMELDLARADAGGVGLEARRKLLRAGLAAADRDRVPYRDFHSVIVVLTHRWSIDGVPDGVDWSHPQWGQYWIEGSAVGTSVVQTPEFSANVLAHEMGHGYSLSHDWSADLQTAYADPCCVMSQTPAFWHERWHETGPGLCLPHLVQRGWMLTRRLFQDEGEWLRRAEGVTVPLAPVTAAAARANLGVRLRYTGPGEPFDYFVEYVKPSEWNKALSEPAVIVRRLRVVAGDGETAIYLGRISLPQSGFTEFFDTTTNISFRVYRFVDDRIVRLHALRRP